jgi:DNA-directed RNA polymerase specialized sigma24 family protein
VNRVLQEIRRLPESYGLPLLLYAAGGLTYHEIAAQFSLPVATVKVRIHRARLMLAEALEPASKEIKK